MNKKAYNKDKKREREENKMTYKVYEKCGNDTVLRMATENRELAVNYLAFKRSCRARVWIEVEKEA